jgi:hypothetical protein
MATHSCNTDGENGCTVGLGWNVNGRWCCCNHYDFSPKPSIAPYGLRGVAEEFINLIASGEFPLREGYNRLKEKYQEFNLASAAVERVDRLQRLSIQTPGEKLERLTTIAERVYWLRTEAAGTGEHWIEFYNSLILLGHALKVNAGQLPAERKLNHAENVQGVINA